MIDTLEDWNIIDFPSSKEDIRCDNKKTFWRKIRNYFREYCNSTSIHGFRYFGEKRTIFERIWWFFVFVACVIACVYSIYLVYQKWDNSPVIVTFATKETPIYNIPFPAVTVCPESKSVQGRFNYTNIMLKKKNNETLTDKEITQFEYMSLVCHYEESINYSYVANETFTDDFYDIISKVKPRFLLNECKFMGRDEKCNKIFTPIITDEGICYTFNILNRSDIYREGIVHYKRYHKITQKMNNWDMQQGYYPNAPIMESYPRRALYTGAKNGLSFTIYAIKQHIDYACKNALQGYRVSLHIPIRLARVSQAYFRVPLNQAVMAAIQPVMITTSSSVKLYKPQKRQCYFLEERQLKYFKIYSQLNCQMECLTEYTLNSCGCVNYFMPRYNDTPICGTGRVKCMEQAERTMQIKNIESERDLQLKTGIKHQKGCNCLPICTDITYNTETSQVDIDLMAELRAFNYTIPKNLTEKDVYQSRLELYFKSSQFITSERNVLYGPTDFLANFGGLLGLFTGFSVLSLMEILYFLSVRLICNMKLYGYWAGPDS